MNDNVNSPKHYTTGGIECIDYIQDKLTPEEFRGYIKGNVLKYITRERHKNGDEDLKKAKWYLDRLISTVEQEKVEILKDLQETQLAQIPKLFKCRDRKCELFDIIGMCCSVIYTGCVPYEMINKCPKLHKLWYGEGGTNNETN